MTSGQYQAFFNEVTGQGYKPVVVCGYGDGAQDRYAAIFRKIPGAPAWQARHGLSAADYQAEFNNELRWLVWDLLSGRVSHEHRLWTWLTEICGAAPSELSWFADNPCPPALIGVKKLDTDDDVICFCHHGMRSMDVANWLRAQGVKSAKSLAGGIDRWSIEIDPKVPRY